MKTIRYFISALVAIVALFIAAPSTSSQTLTKSQLRAVLTELQKNIPLEVEKGMIWTEVNLNTDATIMTWTFSFDPTKMGLTLAEAKEEMNSYTDSEFRKILGDEFSKMMKSFGCQVNVVLVYPDKTTKKFYFKE